MSGTTGRRTSIAARRVGALAVLSALCAVCFAVAVPAGAAPTGPAPTVAGTPKTVHAVLVPNRVFTPTAIIVKTGDTVTVTAQGRIHFGGGPIANLLLRGIPWGAQCHAVAHGLALTTPWPAPGVSCWSLIGKVGRDGKPFEIGTGTTFKAANAGNLVLGVNDNFVNDNTGRILVTVVVTPPGVAAPTTTPTTPTGAPAPAPPPAKKKSSSNTGLFLLVGALLVVVVLLIAFFAMRRRRGSDEPEPAPEIVPPLAPVAAAPLLRPTPIEEEVITPVPVGAAPLPESIDVNIFEVEFNNGLTMRVGYNHFPEGIDLRWRVTQNRSPVAVGTFRTHGGGSTNHFETVPLGVKLEGRDTHPDGADVQFDWMINDVPFRYSVRRDPNC